MCICLILCKTLVLHLYTWASKHIQQVAYKDNTLFHQTDFLLFISTKNCVPHFSCDCHYILGIVSKAMRNKWIDKRLLKRTKHGDKNIIQIFISFEPLHKHMYINICCINKIWQCIIKRDNRMCYKYASGTILVIDIFAICKYFKIIFTSASCRKPQNRSKRCFKIQDCLQACVIK